MQCAQKEAMRQREQDEEAPLVNLVAEEAPEPVDSRRVAGVEQVADQTEMLSLDVADQIVLMPPGEEDGRGLRTTTTSLAHSGRG